MPLYIFEVWHASPRAARAPSSVSIRAAFQAAALQQSGVGGWVAPARITRKGGALSNSIDIFGTSPQNQTAAVAAYEVPDGTSERRAVAILSAVRDRLEAVLPRIGGVEGEWSNVLVTAFSAANGDEAWWRSGAASRTATEDQFPTITTDADENPRGPTGADTHPSTVAETLERMNDRLNRTTDAGSGLLWAGAALGLVALVGYGVWSMNKAREAAYVARFDLPQNEPWA